ncbi:MAG: nucleotide sugar dehydrogenase [Syntrophomonadaceae bacterium]|nr:nucleotide sugar dehydrogenase [Syntrophomonadaceae bacterium]
MKKVCVLGLGYIGLPTAVILALNGQQVIGVDNDFKLLEKLNKGEVNNEEPDLAYFFKQVIKEGRLSFSHSPAAAADVFIIAVPTPNKDDKSSDLSFVFDALNSILPYLAPENLVIIESTIPPQTCDRLIKPIIEKVGFIVGENIYLAHCPERVLPGQIMEELIKNNRIIGGCTPKCSKAAAEIYQTFVKGEIMETDAATAEMTKLMENTFRDVNIALVNELVKICDYLEINALKAIELANKHPRVSFHKPGPGVGGHCLAIDPYFIIEKAPHLARIISDARNINRSMPAYIVDRVKILLGSKKSARIAVLGVSYKGNIDDIRESPALEIISLLKKENFYISIYDPYVQIKGNEKDINLAVQGADLILILTDHNEFLHLDYKLLAKKMRTPMVFDTRNIINAEDYACSEIRIYKLGNVIPVYE